MSAFFKNLPKIELHVHLDCSLSFDAVRQLEPGISRADYLQRFVAPKDGHGLPEYLSRAVAGIELMQTPAQLEIVTADLFEQFREDHILYAEVRFAPLEHTLGGMTPREVVSAVSDATHRAIARTGVEGRLLLCTLRHYTTAQSMETVQLVHEFQHDLVAGFDIAGDEAAYPLDPHLPAFEYARQHQIPITAHAGEAKGSDSVLETLEKIDPHRIGHGVRSIEDATLVELLHTRKIHLEVCPTSNIRTQVFPALQSHSVDALYQAGISLGINTDGRAISFVSLTEEYEKLHHTFGWTPAHFLRCNLNALEAAFIPETLRSPLRATLLKGYETT